MSAWIFQDAKGRQATPPFRSELDRDLLVSLIAVVFQLKDVMNWMKRMLMQTDGRNVRLK